MVSLNRFLVGEKKYVKKELVQKTYVMFIKQRKWKIFIPMKLNLRRFHALYFRLSMLKRLFIILLKLYGY